MEITEIKISLIAEKENKVKAFAGIVIDNAIAIHDIKIVQASEKIIVAMPCKKKNEVYMDLVHPINNEVRKTLESNVLKQFYKLVNKRLSIVELPKGYFVECDELNINDIYLKKEENQDFGYQYEIQNYDDKTLKMVEKDMNYLIQKEGEN